MGNEMKREADQKDVGGMIQRDDKGKSESGIQKFRQNNGKEAYLIFKLLFKKRTHSNKRIHRRISQNYYICMKMRICKWFSFSL